VEFATSNSLLITQPLTYQVTVNNGTGLQPGLEPGIAVGQWRFRSRNRLQRGDTPVVQPAAVDAVKSVSPTGQVTPGTTLTYTIEVQETTAIQPPMWW
jgi:hypothetical protein